MVTEVLQSQRLELEQLVVASINLTVVKIVDAEEDEALQEAKTNAPPWEFYQKTVKACRQGRCYRCTRQDRRLTR